MGLLIHDHLIKRWRIFLIGSLGGLAVDRDFFLRQLEIHGVGLFFLGLWLEQARVDIRPLDVEGARNDFVVERIAHPLDGNMAAPIPKEQMHKDRKRERGQDPLGHGIAFLRRWLVKDSGPAAHGAKLESPP